MGDDTPPDEVNIVEEGKNYGWPNCYGKNIHDTDFDKNTYFRNPCMEPFEMPSYIDIPAHSAPLGLVFIPGGTTVSGWPKEYWYNLLVAYHGSWNRSVPTGYKIARYKLDAQGNPIAGEPVAEDFITGWLRSDGTALGRPAGLLVQPDGTMYISDDKAGVIYRVVYKGKPKSDISDIIRVKNVSHGATVKSPLEVLGEARGTWFFEATFPVRLLDANGKELARSPAQAQGDWMTENFVPFKAELTFKTPTTKTGTLVLEKDNPSGLPENANELRVPIQFDMKALSGEVKTCKMSGCSGQVCSDQDVITTCEFRPEYACYQKAKCEVQPSGECGWAETAALVSCLNKTK